MNKLLLYNDKIFLNARTFYEFVLDNVYEGEEPTNWKLEYIAVCWTNKLKTIAGINVDWVMVDDEMYSKLKETKNGWLRWSQGKDKTFIEFIAEMNVSFTKEDLWRWAVDYVITYDLPRLRMKRFVDEVLEQSVAVDKYKGVLVYRLIKNLASNEKTNVD